MGEKTGRKAVRCRGNLRIEMVSPFWVLRSQEMSGVRWSISRLAQRASGRREDSRRASMERILLVEEEM